MPNPIDKYRSNAVLEGGGAGGGYKSSGYRSPNPDSEAMGTLAKAFGIPLAVSGTGVALNRSYKGDDGQEAREAAAEMKRETRGVQKTSTDRARDDAREMKMQQQNEKASREASRDMGMKKGGHVHHSEHYGKHAGGHKLHMDHVKAMCGGGYMKKAKK